uniref:Small ribosomal subunit protein bS20c n=1 Tax=Polysiphonia sertularioides TaxID=945028 RepID=A0A1Z1M8R9_9FLOR|nr:ribosomal protein S20 [Polysiphonia sertularioides]ARW62487.1 ribosomal protein S20 [Polysiphonia sertularioides]
MPQTKSHIKNIKITLRNRNTNKKYKFAVKQAIKKYLISLKKIKIDLNDQNLNICNNMLSDVYKVLDKAVNKNVLHKNKAARKKSRLVKLLR